MRRLNKKESRTKQFNVSLTESELASIKSRAEALGMRPVHFGRAVLLEEGHKFVPARETDSIDNNAQRLVYTQLSKLGNLLNQMVRHLHRTGDPLPADLEPLLKDIRHILDRRVLK